MFIVGPTSTRICLLYFFLQRVSCYIFLFIFVHLHTYIVFPQIRGEPSFYKLFFHRFPPTLLLSDLNSLFFFYIEIVMMTLHVFDPFM